MERYSVSATGSFHYSTATHHFTTLIPNLQCYACADGLLTTDDGGFGIGLGGKGHAGSFHDNGLGWGGCAINLDADDVLGGEVEAAENGVCLFSGQLSGGLEGFFAGDRDRFVTGGKANPIDPSGPGFDGVIHDHPSFVVGDAEADGVGGAVADELLFVVVVAVLRAEADASGLQPIDVAGFEQADDSGRSLGGLVLDVLGGLALDFNPEADLGDRGGNLFDAFASDAEGAQGLFLGHGGAGGEADRASGDRAGGDKGGGQGQGDREGQAEGYRANAEHGDWNPLLEMLLVWPRPRAIGARLLKLKRVFPSVGPGRTRYSFGWAPPTSLQFGANFFDAFAVEAQIRLAEARSRSNLNDAAGSVGVELDVIDVAHQLGCEFGVEVAVGRFDDRGAVHRLDDRFEGFDRVSGAAR